MISPGRMESHLSLYSQAMRLIVNLSIILLPWSLAVAAGLFAIEYADAAAKVCKQLGFPAVVLAAFSAAAFNLRFRLMNTIQKFDFKQSQIDHLQGVFKRCRDKVDHCLMLFMATAIVLLAVKLLSEMPDSVRPLLLGTSALLFSLSFIRFVQILKSLRDMEDFSFKHMRSAAEFK